MDFLVACKNEDDPIKNEGAIVVTTLFIYFSDTQGELTLKSVMESCINSNSSKLLRLFLLHVRVEKIQQQTEALEWSQHFSQYKSMGIFHPPKCSYSTVQGPIWPKFEPIRDFIGILIACKNKENPIKMKMLECSLHYSSFFKMLKGSSLHNRYWELDEIQTHPLQAFIVVLLICKSEEDPF